MSVIRDFFFLIYYRFLQSFPMGTGNSIARFNRSGNRLLCSRKIRSWTGRLRSSHSAVSDQWWHWKSSSKCPGFRRRWNWGYGLLLIYGHRRWNGHFWIKGWQLVHLVTAGSKETSVLGRWRSPGCSPRTRRHNQLYSVQQWQVYHHFMWWRWSHQIVDSSSWLYRLNHMNSRM